MKNLTPILATSLAIAALGVSGLAQGWTLQSPINSPGARRTGSMAFDRSTGLLLLHGGLTSSPTASNGETWAYDGLTWTQLSPSTTSPYQAAPNRWGHRMVFDTWRNRIVTFGGRSPTLTANANDTWEYDGTGWQQMAPAASPTARAFYSMAFDERRGRTVMFGSMSPFDGFQTWEYDGTTWTMINTPTTMVSRETPGMCYDRGRGVIVLFGGWNASSPGTMYNDTWEYDGVDWRQVTTVNSPIARYRASMVYDNRRGRVVLYGGFGNATALQDSWEYDGNDWTLVASAGPTKSTECYAEFDPAVGQVVLFGGSGPGGNSAETWHYDGPHTAIFGTFGPGCPASQGVPALSAAQPPRMGQLFQIDVGNLAAGASCVLALGFDSHIWGPLRLPFDLSITGLTGCRMELDPVFATALPVVGATASMQLMVPTTATLQDAPLFAQAVVLDFAAPNGLGGASNAGHAVIGQ